ncbi:Insect cuticle protein [Popillia japonica]|uniref:Insect cuticle protein n=1 Tax=Popillia japonica TaxID=7064 RepID=A0AAW1HRF8_POPJA
MEPVIVQINEKFVQLCGQNGYAPKYSFGYRVVDSHSGVDYGHQETRDGKRTTGRYHVLLPDGRLQSVNYWSDFRGYHAKVTYSNLAHH